MKIGLYPRLAFGAIGKNKKLYFPYFLTFGLMTAIFYIISSLSTSVVLNNAAAGAPLQIILGLGQWIIGAFSLLFLFYTNSFLIKRRKREFGIYNILGMNKRNIAKILFCEIIYTFLFSEAVGLAVGISLSKLAELVLVNIIKGEVTFDFTVSIDALIKTLIVFGVILFLIFIKSIYQLRKENTLSLLKSDSVSDKKPKANGLIGILGLILLAAAYYIALTRENPMQALEAFFIAVIMVIVATFMLFISGSVLLCNILKKNKNYYYKKNHFVSVSSMTYRMSRNGAGLASICILSTMVLVMMVGASSLYFGADDSINQRYPRDITITISGAEKNSKIEEDVVKIADDELSQIGGKISNTAKYGAYVAFGSFENNEISFDPVGGTLLQNVGTLNEFFFISLDDFNAVTNNNKTLNDDEIFVISPKSKANLKSLKIKNFNEFHVKEVLNDEIPNPDISAVINDVLIVIVKDSEEFVKPFAKLADYSGNKLFTYIFNYYFDTGISAEAQKELNKSLKGKISDYFKQNKSDVSCSCQAQETSKSDFYSLYGGIFFIGLMFTVVFVLAAVLIIYYKQISEGYEDKKGFEIMQKVGMTKRDIRKNVNSQMLLVFFIPLVTAVIHTCFSLPIMMKLLVSFAIRNNLLIILVTVAVVAIFALFYILIYKITSNVYYGIVSEMKREI